MKIERINDNQIRCILNSTDLSERQIDLNELAYGSGKARQLFHEMIEKAYQDLGFEVEDTPLMVEAIPLPMNSIMLIISKIDEPEELDSRYSRFAPTVEEDILSDLFSLPAQLLEGAAEAVRKRTAQKSEPADSDDASAKKPSEAASASVVTPTEAVRIYEFTSLRDMAHAASLLEAPDSTCLSTLYRPEPGLYHMVLIPTDIPDARYSRICNVMAEFGEKLPGGLTSAAHHDEHYEKLLERNALSEIAKLY